jgi:site-specific DNA-adenine methylase
MKPIVKWVGGKTGNLEHIRKLLEALEDISSRAVIN